MNRQLVLLQIRQKHMNIDKLFSQNYDQDSRR